MKAVIEAKTHRPMIGLSGSEDIDESKMRQMSERIDRTKTIQETASFFFISNSISLPLMR
jgi:heptaprenylglyceryl phosphate synthase